MKRAGQIFSGICITLVVAIHLVQITKPFEWQRKAAEKIDYEAFFQQRDLERRAENIRLGLPDSIQLPEGVEIPEDFELPPFVRK